MRPRKGVDRMDAFIVTCIIALGINYFIPSKKTNVEEPDKPAVTFSLDEEREKFKDYVNSLKVSGVNLSDYLSDYLKENKEKIHSYVNNLNVMTEESLNDIIKKRIENIISEIDEINPQYNYEDLYITREDVNKIIEESKTTKTCDNADIGREILIQRIVENSNSFEKENNNYISAFFYEDDNINKSKLSKTLTYAIYLNSIDSNNEILKENICKMKNLKIMIDNNLDAQALYTADDDLIILNIKEIEKAYQQYCNIYNETKDIKDIYEYIFKIIRNDLNHVDSQICDHRKEKGQSYSTIAMALDNGDHIGYSINEAAAESDLYKNDVVGLKNTYVSENYRKIEGLLLLLSIFNDKPIEDYYNSIENTDLNAFFEYFDLNDEEEIYKFYKILYGLEARELTNDFISKVYPDKESISKKEIKGAVGNGCFVDLYKMFLKRLTNYTLNNELSLEDNIILNRFALGIILEESNHDWNSEYKISIYDDNFKNDITKLNEIYNKFLQSFYGVDLSQISEKNISLRINEITLCNVNDYKAEIFDKFKKLENIKYSFYNNDSNFIYKSLEYSFSKSLKFN